VPEGTREPQLQGFAAMMTDAHHQGNFKGSQFDFDESDPDYLGHQ
jgi:hypothetical protein